MNSTNLLAKSNLPRHEAERLLMSATGKPRADLLSGIDLAPEDENTFESLASRRAAGEPLQYLEGTVEFGPIELAVDERALIPRPETEAVWDEARRMLGEAGKGTVIVDLCTGSGAMALALKAVFPEARVFATDISEPALSLAEDNAARLGLDIEFFHGDLFEALPKSIYGRVDLLVSNPPYIEEGEWDGLPPDVRDHEPRRALVSGPEGTEILERIANDIYWWLGVGGWVLCEIGETQGRRADELFGQWLDTEVRPDLTGRDRILVGRKGARCCV
ncbi:MAG TPA: peptide chain release factor N(5)-glutamine methyltransferase [Acidimicrobiia bacterium]|nr:peptide chain release factor N(5)-glutamine methyltransferase [Acidimicrobiia bacterium]